MREWASCLVRLHRRHVFVYILSLFLLTRLLYVLIGTSSINTLNQYKPANLNIYNPTISSHTAIQMWYVWDSGHYANVAHDYNGSLSKLPPTHQLPNGKRQYYLLSWFPLYSLSAKLVHGITHIPISYALLLISNVSFLGALYVFYKLVRLEADDRFARLALVVFMLLPTSFIFSAALSESLFLLLAVSSLYAARTNRWILAGLLGALVALTRSVGFLIVIPLAFEALQQYGFRLSRWRAYLKPLLACLLTTAGLLLFLGYCWLRTGNFLAYIESQYVGWGGLSFHDPLVYLIKTAYKPKTLIVWAELATVVLAFRRIRWSYIAYTILFALAAVSIGNKSGPSQLRYIAILFPVAIALTYWMRRQQLQPYIWATLGIIHGAFFIMWANWWLGYII